MSHQCRCHVPVVLPRTCPSLCSQTLWRCMGQTWTVARCHWRLLWWCGRQPHSNARLHPLLALWTSAHLAFLCPVPVESSTHLEVTKKRMKHCVGSSLQSRNMLFASRYIIGVCLTDRSWPCGKFIYRIFLSTSSTFLLLIHHRNITWLNHEAFLTL